CATATDAPTSRAAAAPIPTIRLGDILSSFPREPVGSRLSAVGRMGRRLSSLRALLVVLASSQQAIGSKRRIPSLLPTAYCLLVTADCGLVRRHPAARATRRGFLLLRLVGDERLGREQHPGDGGRVLDRAARDLGGIDDPGGYHLRVFPRRGVESLPLR